MARTREEAKMKAKLTKLAASIAAVLLAITFVVVALLTAERAVAATEGMPDEFLLCALAVIGVGVSVVKNTSRRREGERNALSLQVAHDHRRNPARAAFVKASS